jgi:hypothetical protein
MTTPGVDHPEEQSEATVDLTGRNISVSTRVEFAGQGVLAVRPSVSDFVDQTVVKVGDSVDVFWQASDGIRSVPAEVLSVDQHGAMVRWRLQIRGEAEQTQRRKAVRGRMGVPVEVGHSAYDLVGETVDLSETGARVAVDALGLEPEPGSSVDVIVSLEDGDVKTRGEVVRLQSRGSKWVLSIRFLNLAEKDADRIRRRVFQALREERARESD